MPGDGPPDAGAPAFMVISGDASAEEIAAVLGAVAGMGSSTRPRPRGVRAWADRPAMLRKPLRPGPDAWRTSGRPR